MAAAREAAAEAEAAANSAVEAMVGLWLIAQAVESPTDAKNFLLLLGQMALLKFATENGVHDVLHAGGEAAEAGPTEPKAEEGASKEEEQGATEDGVVDAPPTKGPPTAKVAPEN